MRRTRLRWMYLPRTPKKESKDHPMQVQNSEHFLRTAAAVATLTCIVAAITALRKVQTRQRQSTQELVRKRSGPRVVVIGAGAGGCAAAALLTNAAPDVRLTVIEKDRLQTFYGQVAVAHTGHRSYDLGTTTGVDSLRSPATWNVTRDANLVAAEVLRVDPAAKTVYVQTTQGMLASARPLSEEEEVAASTRATTGGASNRLVRWWRGAPATPAIISMNEDGSPNLADGTTVLAYDALIVAAGAQRTMGHLRDKLLPHQIDNYRIAVNPGTTRDCLTTLFSGRVVHVKMPPASFVWQMEAARALLGKAATKGTGRCTALDFGAENRITSTSGNASASINTAPFAASAIVDEPTVLSRAWAAVRGRVARKTLRAPAAGDAEENAALEDEVALRLAAQAAPSTAASPPAPFSPPLFLLAQWCMHFSSRQHDSTFVSSTNTILKYLSYFNKLSLCDLFTVTADPQPIGPAPPQVNAVIERFWRERQLSCRQGSSVLEDRFHVLFHSYVTSIDSDANTVTLYDYKNNAEVRVPFHLLVLDLPLRAPGFVRRSGLHRTRYVEDCVLPALAAGTAAGTAATGTALRGHPLLRMSKAALEDVFTDETSFMDVDPTTLQHRRYPDVFALGDVAGLPSIKSYGAVFAQVPVVVHNVRQVLAAQRAVASTDADPAAAPPKPTRSLPQANARYNGYASFHVVMTTWRAMWPEMQYSFDPYEAAKRATPSTAVSTPVAALPTDEAAQRRKEAWDVVSPLAYCDHHVWNNLTWRDARGFLNALYYQSALYELMYFFVFSRGQWHSPTWFSMPTYSTEDGTPSVPSLVSFL